MATRSTNTFPEILQRLLGDIAQAMTLADADLDFLTEMQGMVVQQLRAPVTQMMDAGILPPDSPPGMAGAGAAPPQLPPGGGMMPQAAMPPVDELRRLMSAGQ